MICSMAKKPFSGNPSKNNLAAIRQAKSIKI
jgi:hypothetical protein